jgi:hypothetical protein
VVRRLEHAEVADVWHGIDNAGSWPVENQRNLAPTRQLPRLLRRARRRAVGAAAAHGVYGTARRRRREVAVLQVLG